MKSYGRVSSWVLLPDEGDGDEVQQGHRWDERGRRWRRLLLLWLSLATRILPPRDLCKRASRARARMERTAPTNTTRAGKNKLSNPRAEAYTQFSNVEAI